MGIRRKAAVIKDVLSNKRDKLPQIALQSLTKRGLTNFLSDKAYIKLQFRAAKGYKIDLKDPKTINEKIQWLKLYDFKPEYSELVDKYEVKKYVKEKLGEGHVIPTLGIYNSFDEIDFDLLPDEFVLKCTHDSGSIVFCRDKNTFDKEKARKKLTEAQNTDYYYASREKPYKYVKPRIIAEPLMKNESTDNPEGSLFDYKFFCFNGEPRLISYAEGLSNHATARISFFTTDWTMTHYVRKDFTPFETAPKKPAKLEELTRTAKILCEGFKFLRVDLYEINGQIYLSELTLYPTGGYLPLVSYDMEKEMGDMLNLSE